MRTFLRVAAGVVAAASMAAVAFGQQEFPPPQGKGRVVVVASGMSGPEHYRAVSADLAQMGYDVVLFDGEAMEGTHGEALKTAIAQAQQMPHALPGKVALVSFSAGGGITLYYGSQLPDLVTGVVVWYPATSMIRDVPGFVSRIKVPVLMFAGEKDTYRNCCLITTAHTLADAATAAGAQFVLVTYPKTEHDFVRNGAHYNASSYADALQRTQARLKEYLGN
ncbi:MAG TPA: dienelactone hydrolase family protein [Acidobacteriaceae bacterium]|jgi:dienelactone hydrolase|nr:dienelactone hydrolase family protein [Acidobacteriaceae bacterium]